MRTRSVASECAGRDLIRPHQIAIMAYVAKGHDFELSQCLVATALVLPIHSNERTALASSEH